MHRQPHRHVAHRAPRAAALILAMGLAATSAALADVTCNAAGTACWGSYGEVVDHIVTFHHGRVVVQVTQEVIDGITAGTDPPCTPNGTGMQVPEDPDPGEDLILKQLFISHVRNAHVVLRFHQGASGFCEIGYVRALFGE